MFDPRIRWFFTAALLLAGACGSDEASPTGGDGTGGAGAGAGTGGGADAEPGADGAAETGADASTDTGAEAGADGPLYFIAVHNEPWHKPGGSTNLASEYQILRQMVAKADDVNVKLTLMFTAQWADYIVESADRVDEVRGWKAMGHELAAHHHSVFHGNWDGYTNYTEAEAIAHRLEAVSVPEAYLGPMSDYAARLSVLDADIASGCLNDEPDLKDLPPSIRFDTCLGYANHGDDWFPESDADTPEKGINEFVTVGEWDGVKRSWLAHYQITRPERTAAAKTAFDGLQSGVYGVVLHSAEFEAPELYDYLTFLSARDPAGARSRTVRQIVESGVLPERAIPTELLETKLTPEPAGLCGDDVCDAAEQANPSLCPADCSSGGLCGDGVCDAVEQADPTLCPADCP